MSDCTVVEDIIEYRRRVGPSYRDMRNKVVSEFTTAMSKGTLSEAGKQNLMSAVNSHLDTLAAHWSMSTEDLYIENAKEADRAVERFAGYKPTTSPEQYGQHNHMQAMAYLTDPGGLLADLRGELQQLIVGLAARAMTRSEIDDVAVESGTAVAMMVDSQEYRIDNWAGRLVLYGNQRAIDGLHEVGTVAGKDGETPVATEWMVEWCCVGDKNMCATCEKEGGLGFRTLSSLTTIPGGATECRGRCRCVLVFWTKAEVTDGSAISLSNAEKE